MKVLKIRNTPAGLKYADALRGSLDGDGDSLVGIGRFSGQIHSESVPEIFAIGYIAGEITIPLSTLKLNPFTAMEHGISFIAPNGFEFTAPYDDIFLDDETTFGEAFRFLGKHSYTLDLGPIERGEIEGVELIELEVEE